MPRSSFYKSDFIIQLWDITTFIQVSVSLKGTRRWKYSCSNVCQLVWWRFVYESCVRVLQSYTIVTYFQLLCSCRLY